MSNEGIVLEVYGFQDPTKLIGYLRARRSPKFLEEIGGFGGGSFLVKRNDPNIINNRALLNSRNVVKQRINGEIVGAWLLGAKKATTIDKGEYAGEYWEVSGEGLKKWFDDAIIYTATSLFRSKTKTDRHFSFASPVGTWYDASKWVNPYTMGLVKGTSQPWKGSPSKWPSTGATYARWVWSADGTSTSVGLGDVYFRITLPSMVADNYTLYIAVDDAYEVFLDDESIASYSDLGGWKEAKAINFDLTAGDHIIGIKATNLNTQAGLVAALYRIIDGADQVKLGGCTITIASPGVVTRKAHGFSNGTKVRFTTTGKLPAGLAQNTDYYVRNATTNTFQLAKTSGGAAIKTTGTQSGVHTLYKSAIPDKPKIITFSGMDVTYINSILTTENSKLTQLTNTYNGLPAGNSSGTATQKKQYKAKQDALAKMKKQQAVVNEVTNELNAASAAASQGITWKCMGYPTSPPGWNPGEVITKLLDEAQARGVMFPTLMTKTYTATTDSRGNPWADVDEWVLKIGSSMADLVKKIEELYADIWIDPDTYALSIAANRGQDRTVYTYGTGGIVTNTPVIFRRGKNLTEASTEFSSQIKNSMIGKGDNGWLPIPITGTVESIAAYGRLEAAVDSGASDKITVALALKALADSREEEEAASYNIFIPPTGKIPWIDFFPGDYVLAPDTNDTLIPRRVMSISVDESNSAQPIYNVELDIIPRGGFVQRTNTALGNLGPGASGVGGGYANSGGAGAVSPPDTISTILQPVVIVPEVELIPSAPTDIDGASIGAWSADGVRATSQANLTWEPVTTNTDESDLVPSYYEVWGRATDESTDTWVVDVPAQTIDHAAVTLLSLDGTDASGWTTSVVDAAGSGTTGASFTSVSGALRLATVGQTAAVNPNPSVMVTRTLPTEVGRSYTFTGTALGSFEGLQIRVVIGDQSWTSPNPTTANNWSLTFTSMDDTVDIQLIIEDNPASSTAVSTTSVRADFDNIMVVGPAYSETLDEQGHWDPGSTYALMGRVEVPSISMQDFVPGTLWNFRILCYNYDGVASAPSDDYSLTMLGPIDPMDAPDLPILTSEKGVLIVSWNGMLNGNPPPMQFRYVYAMVAPDVSGSPGTYVQRGQALQRDGRNITVPKLTIGQKYWVYLVAVDGSNIPSANSAAASITIVGVDLGDLTANVTAAIDAAKAAGEAARSMINLLGDPSFEMNTNEYWTVNAPATNVTTTPRTGTRNLRLPGSATAYEALKYNKPIPCDPGDNIYFRFYVNVNASASEDGLKIGVSYGATSALGSTIDIGPSGTPTPSIWQMVTASWTVPDGVFFYVPRLWISDSNTSAVYMVDDARIYVMTGEETLVNGAITTDKLAAGAVVAEKIQAESIATEHIQSESITGDKIQAETITGDKLVANAITANLIDAGAIQTLHLSPSVGDELDISANDAVTIISGNLDTIQTQVDGVNQAVSDMQTVYTFGPDGALITAAGQVYSLALQAGQIQILENGNIVSWWDSGTLNVKQFAGEVVTLGNHQLAKYNTGTVVRAL